MGALYLRRRSKRVDLLAIEQSKRFNTLDRRTQDLVKQLQNQQTNSTASFMKVEQSLANLSVQSNQMRSSLVDSRSAIQQDIGDLKSNVGKHFDDLRMRDAEEERDVWVANGSHSSVEYGGDSKGVL